MTLFLACARAYRASLLRLRLPLTRKATPELLHKAVRMPNMAVIQEGEMITLILKSGRSISGAYRRSRNVDDIYVGPWAVAREDISAWALGQNVTGRIGKSETLT